LCCKIKISRQDAKHAKSRKEFSFRLQLQLASETEAMAKTATEFTITCAMTPKGERRKLPVRFD
jgi:hypothetical protein